MSSVPVITGQQAVKAFSKLGFSVARIRVGHHIMKKEGHRYVLSVPVHAGKTLSQGTLQSLIRVAEITEEEFAELLI